VSEIPHSSADLEQIYRERFSGNPEYRNRVWKTLTSSFFSRWIAPDAAVLDLGCGYCEFINNIAAGTKFGMDLNPDAARNAAAGVTVFQQDCSTPWPVPEGSLDAVFTSNFFEHLPSKGHLEKTLQHAWMALRPGGVLIAMGPNIKYLPGLYWDFFDHYIELTERSLTEVLKKCGYSIEKMEARFLPYTMSDGRRYPQALLRMYLALPLAWRFFGKQFLVVARKR
jgi:SAM-dependent methyltransferase